MKRTDRKWSRRVALLVVLASVVLGLVVPNAWAAGNNVGKNVGDLLKQYAGDLYGGIVAAFSLVFSLEPSLCRAGDGGACR